MSRWIAPFSKGPPSFLGGFFSRFKTIKPTLSSIQYPIIISDIDTNIDNRFARITVAVRDCMIMSRQEWSEIKNKHSDACLFGIDCLTSSFQIWEDGKFDGRADIIINFPYATASGTKTTASESIPSLVHGKILSPNKIEITKFELRFR